MSFNFNGGGFDFSAKPTKKAKQSKEPTTDYQQRNKQEQDRFKLATCSNFFSTVCFNTEEEKKEFQKRLGSERTYYAICEFEEVFGSFKKHSRDWKTKERITKADFEKWEDPATFEDVCINDLKHLFTLFEEAKNKEIKYVLDSPFFIALVAKDDEDMQKFLTQYKLFRYGDRFLDGSSWLRDISE